MAKIGKENDKQAALDREGASLPDHDVSSEKVSSAFRETLAPREHAAEIEKTDAPAAGKTIEPAAKIADNGPDLNSANIAEEFQALTQTPKLAREQKQTPERFRQRRPGRSR